MAVVSQDRTKKATKTRKCGGSGDSGGFIPI
ncbi:hypothetical protein BH18THE2_BH18THE2_36120 [soil metagenome]